MDIFVYDDDPGGCLAIVEIKASDWNAMTDRAVRRNVRRQIKQVWDYIEPLIEEYVENGGGKSVSPGIIFSKRPQSKDRLKLIEESFLEEGIVAVWDDESIAECKKRNKAK